MKMTNKFKSSEKTSTINNEKISNYVHFMVMPLRCVGCWDWYIKPKNEYQIFLNNIYLCFVLFILLNLPISLIVHLYTSWTDMMSSLDNMADGLPLLVSVFIVAYFSTHKNDLYELVRYINENFKWHSARGLTNMTMLKSYETAKRFAYWYTGCTLFSVTMYVIMPIVAHLWTKNSLQPWIYKDMSSAPVIALVFLRQCLAQAFVGLAVGQLGVFFACNSILLCGQLDLLCCSLRNVRYTALLQRGVEHAAIAKLYEDITLDERHQYLYNLSEMSDSVYHYDDKIRSNFKGNVHFDIYSPQYDEATSQALRECGRVCQIINEFKDKFEEFVSPLLVLRVVQVTLYLCTLLYSASLKFDMMTVEYLGAVAFDIFVYCYFGNQIILQAGRVPLAAYQSAWAAAGARPRRLLLHVLLGAARAPRRAGLRAGSFLAMDLRTFVVIIKTSFSYYTLLVNVNEEK